MVLHLSIMYIMDMKIYLFLVQIHVRSLFCRGIRKHFLIVRQNEAYHEDSDVASGYLCLLDWPIGDFSGSTQLYLVGEFLLEIITLFKWVFFFYFPFLCKLTFVPFSSQLPVYFIVSLGCYGLLMVGVGLMRFPTCPQEAILLQKVFIFLPFHLFGFFFG